MSNYIITHWKKLPMLWRQHILAVLLTIIIYALLLVLFRPIPQTPPTEITAAGTIQPILLDRQANADLALWLQHHDPSTTIDPDRLHGYSQVLDREVAHPRPEDLPAPPPLSLPQMPEMVRLTPRRTSRKNIMPQPGVWHTARAQVPNSADLAPVAVWINGHRSQQLEKAVQSMLSGQQLELSGKDQLTILRTAPERMSGQLFDINIERSSGIKTLDILAVSAIYYYMQENPGALRQYDNITLLWRIENYRKEPKK